MVANIERLPPPPPPPPFKISGSAPGQSLFFNKVAGLQHLFLQNTSGGCFCHVSLIQNMRIIDELQKIKIKSTSY